MAGDEDRDAVLAFLLGSTPELHAIPAASPAAVEESEEEEPGDPPELEPVSDSDAATADAVTSSESEGEGDQQTAVSEGEAGDVEGEEEGEEEEEEKPLIKGRSISEAEHEDDCAAASSTESEEEERQQVPMKAKEKQKEPGEPRAATEVKAVKTPATRRGARPAAAVATKVVTSRKGLSVKKAAHLQQNGCGEGVPTLEELLFVGCVATVLVAYLVACVYSFFHPLEVPLPSYEGLYSAYDMSNLSVRIVNPLDDSQITPQGVWLEWEFANFPAGALQQYGAEVFRYRVSLDDEVITSEVGFLALDDGKEGISSLNSFDRTVRTPIPRRKFTHDDDIGTESTRFKLHLEVTVPIPGLIGELKTYEQEINVWRPVDPSPEDGVQLAITSPLDGVTVELGQSIVLEYTAANVLKMEVLLNDNIYLRKTHVNDGNFLLRGFGVGLHKFEVRAVDKQDEVAASSMVRVEIVERSTPAQDQE